MKRTFNKRALRFLAIAGIAAYLASCSFYTADRPAVKAEKDRKKAPEFTLKDAAGEVVKLSDYRGKVVLLNFWATWCGPCEVEIPWFIDFQREYKDRDFAVLGVSLDEDGWKSVKPFVAREKVNYRVMVTTEQVDQLYGGVDSLPTTFVIDREGRVASSHVGLASKNTYRQEILTLLDNSRKTGAGQETSGAVGFSAEPTARAESFARSDNSRKAERGAVGFFAEPVARAESFARSDNSRKTGAGQETSGAAGFFAGPVARPASFARSDNSRKAERGAVGFFAGPVARAESFARLDNSRKTERGAAGFFAGPVARAESFAPPRSPGT